MAESYTPDPALVELVAAAIHATHCACASKATYDFDDGIEDQGEDYELAEAAVAALATEGRPDAGTVEWGWSGYDDKDPQRGMPLRDEESARSVVALHPGTQLVRRRVGPWLPAPTTDTEES